MKQLSIISFTLLLLVISLSNRANAQSLSPDLDALLDAKLDSMHVALNNKSLSGAIKMSGNYHWKHAVGISSTFVPVTTDHVYEIGSVAKTMTAACVLQLVDEQVLTLDDSLHEWLAPIPNISGDITIRQLLQHKSGLYDVLGNPSCQPTLLTYQDSIWDPEVLVYTFIMPPPNQPGGTWSYCNTNYFLLGMIIKAATGNNYYTEIRNRFFTPLGLTTPAIPAYETVSSPVAHLWLDINGDAILDDAHTFFFNWLSLNSAAGAAGGYYATPLETSEWMRTYMRGDLLSAIVMDEARITVPAPGLPATTYGLGLMKKQFFGYTGYGHGGDLSYSASSWYFPDLDISVTVTNNDANIISWELSPVIAELLETYVNWLSTAETDELTSSEPLFSVYPIPFTSEVNIDIPQEYTHRKISFEIYSVSGNKLSTTSVNTYNESTSVLTVSGLDRLSSGAYLLKIYTDGELTQIQELIK
ncbi:MAG: serine hydrolase [Fluviicola sp.]|nr:serine hydrolase [Fluviicola sp.]